MFESIDSTDLFELMDSTDSDLTVLLDTEMEDAQEDFQSFVQEELIVQSFVQEELIILDESEEEQ